MGSRPPSTLPSNPVPYPVRPRRRAAPWPDIPRYRARKRKFNVAVLRP
ncbi:hypothetical protein [Azospirillum argentinense]